MKKFISLLLSVAICLSFSSCSFIGISPEKLMEAPDHDGDNKDIISALDEHVGNYQLLYPTDSLTPILIYGKGQKATTVYKNGEGKVKICLLAKNDDWKIEREFPLEITEIEKLEAEELGEETVVVSGEGVINLFTQSSKKGTLPYADYVIEDFNGDGQKELVTVEREDKKAEAKLYSNSLEVLSSVKIGASPTTKRKVAFGKLYENFGALFIDSIFEVSAETEVIYLKDDKLTLLSLDSRESDALSIDINGDGYTEVPFDQVMPSYSDSDYNEREYLTTYKKFNGKEMVTVTTGDFNFAEGYYIEFPEIWQGNITLTVDQTENMRTYSIYDFEDQRVLGDLVKIKAYPSGFSPPAGVITIAEHKDKVYAGRILNTLSSYAVTEKQLKSMFKIIY